MHEKGLVGKQLGNYRIIAEINRGTFGSVYKAEHTHLSERVAAIKLLHTYMDVSKEREQFVQEARFLAMLEHRHILPLFDFGFNDGQPYLVARYASGGSLRSRLKKHQPLPLNEVATLLVQIGLALQYAHSRNIIHRDLKPENLLFDAQGDILLADFGIATKLSTINHSSNHLSTIKGTPPYMAPEQFQGIISKEGDQYALGCIAYELLTGYQPFTASDFLSMGFKHMHDAPVPPCQLNPHLPVPCEAAILKAMAKQRGERYSNISAFIAALQSALKPARAVVSGPIPTAQAMLSSAVRPKPGREDWIDVGNKHYAAGAYNAAQAAYNQALRLDPTFSTAHTNKAFALNALHRYEEAVLACKEALNLDPSSASTWNLQAFALNELQRYAEALLACDQAIFLHPGYVSAYDRKCFALRHLHRHQEALQVCEQVIRLEPGDIGAYDNKVGLLCELQRYDEALLVCKQMIRLEPQDARAYHRKAFIFCELQRYTEVLAVCEQALRLDPKLVQAYGRKAQALNGLRRYQEALLACEQALLLDPDYQSVYDRKGFALGQLKRYDEALLAYEQFIRLSPGDAIAYDNKAWMLCELRRYDEALLACEQAIELAPTFVKAYNRKGYILNQLKRYKEAIQVCEEVLHLDPAFALACHNQAYALEKLGKTTEAQQARLKAKQLSNIS